eukprot:14350536-Heterocapsa_arctica.AAC.1
MRDEGQPGQDGHACLECDCEETPAGGCQPGIQEDDLPRSQGPRRRRHSWATQAGHRPTQEAQPHSGNCATDSAVPAMRLSLLRWT